MSDKLNETFQKHLKLLHEHLNISEAYGDAAHLDWVKNQRQDRRVDWDPDGVTGTRVDDPYTGRLTINGYAKKVGWDDSMIQTYLYWLNNVWRGGTGYDWSRNSTYNGTGDSSEFHNWMKDNARKSQAKQEKELENEIENISDDLKNPMSGLIKTFGTFGWQKYKRKNPEEKIKELLAQAVNNEEKVKKEIGDSDYDTLLKYLNDAEYSFLKHGEYNQKKYTEIMNRTIQKAEKQLGRGFFE